jgi:hypothetical protein
MARWSGAPARIAASTLLVMLAIGSLAACSSDSDTSSKSTGETTPEEKISSAAEVAAGLTAMKSSTATIAAAGAGTSAAKAADANLEPLWKAIEGTVKANDPDLYTEIEDNLSLLEAGAEGDAAKASAGVEGMNTAIDSYLARYPG